MSNLESRKTQAHYLGNETFELITPQDGFKAVDCKVNVIGTGKDLMFGAAVLVMGSSDDGISWEDIEVENGVIELSYDGDNQELSIPDGYDQLMFVPVNIHNSQSVHIEASWIEQPFFKVVQIE